MLATQRTHRPEAVFCSENGSLLDHSRVNEMFHKALARLLRPVA